MRARAPRLVAGLALGLTGCPQVDLIARLDPDLSRDAGSPAPVDGGTGDFCAGGGPVIEVGDGRCGGDLARRTFRFGICTCSGLVTSAALTTDGFDSRAGPYAPGEGGGAVGVDARLDVNARARLGGALWVGGTEGISAGSGGALEVGADLQCGGPIASDATLTVEGDAYVQGRLRAASLRVGGALTQPEGQTYDVAGAVELGAVRSAPVAVAPPCDCRPEALVDIAGEVERRRADHDDPRAGLDPRALQSASGEVSLPCGRYFFESIGAPGDLTLRAEGRVAVYVAGDVSVTGTLRVTLAPGAELDLLIAGGLVAGQAPQIGDPARPARARVYVGGGGTVQLSGGGRFGGNLYAPRAELVSSGPVEVFGSLFARRISASGPLTVHYDRAVQAAADDCPPPPDDLCSACGDCRQGACIAGRCGACRADADCCPPLRCVAGACLVDGAL